MRIELSHEEMDFLRELLEHKRQEIVFEIHRTDHFDYKVKLRQQEHMLDGMLEQLQAKAA